MVSSWETARQDVNGSNEFASRIAERARRFGKDASLWIVRDDFALGREPRAQKTEDETSTSTRFILRTAAIICVVSVLCFPPPSPNPACDISPGWFQTKVLRWMKEGREDEVLKHMGELSAELKPLVDLMMQREKH